MSSDVGYIISLKFAPGLKKEFSLIGEKLRSKGLNIKYLLSEEYEFLDNNLDSMVFLFKSSTLKEILTGTVKFRGIAELDKLLGNENIKFVLFYNNHMLNRPLAKFLKSNYNHVKTLLYFHDPYKPEKRSYGPIKALYILLAEFIARRSLKYIDHVILASEYAYTLFSNHYKKYRGHVHICPLLVPSQSYDKDNNREFFSIIGGYHHATGHEDFMELVNYVGINGGHYHFALITSSNISDLLNKLSEDGKKILTIVNRKLINDSEINNIIAKSYAVFRLDKEVTQSGVIPVSYMNATPIIARDIPGLSQHVQDGRTGYVVPVRCTKGDLISAMNNVMQNFEQLSANARKSYDDIWAEYNFDKYYSWLIKTLNN